MELVQLKTESPLITGFAESRIGGRAENQDSFSWADTPRGFLVTVCDGMGGGPGGKTASSIAVKEIIAGVQEADQQEKVSNILIKAIRRANMAIIAAGNEQPMLQGMGSTCTVLLINSQSATIAHVGDSRVYQLRGHKKIFRTFDHSMVFDLVKQKVITEEQARLSAQSNVITRALNQTGCGGRSSRKALRSWRPFPAMYRRDTWSHGGKADYQTGNQPQISVGQCSR